MALNSESVLQASGVEPKASIYFFTLRRKCKRPIDGKSFLSYETWNLEISWKIRDEYDLVDEFQSVSITLSKHVEFVKSVSFLSGTLTLVTVYEQFEHWECIRYSQKRNDKELVQGLGKRYCDLTIVCRLLSITIFMI